MVVGFGGCGFGFDIIGVMILIFLVCVVGWSMGKRFGVVFMFC